MSGEGPETPMLRPSGRAHHGCLENPSSHELEQCGAFHQVILLKLS